MKLFKKKTTEISKAKISTLDKSQLTTIIGGETEGGPIGGIIVKGGKNPGGGTGK